MTLPPIDHKRHASQQQLYAAGAKKTTTTTSVKHTRALASRTATNNTTVDDTYLLSASDCISSDSSSSFEGNGLTPVHQYKEHGNSDSLELNKSFALPSTTTTSTVGGNSLAMTPTSRKASSATHACTTISVTTPDGSNNNNNNNNKRVVASTTEVRVVCPLKLRAHQAKPRNKSPFDPRVYHPLVPPPVSTLRHRLFLAVDLDETLVHATVVPVPSPTSKSGKNNLMPSYITAVAQQHQGPTTTTRGVCTSGYDFILDLCALTSGEQQEVILVKYRPHVKEFIDFICDRFEVAIFTASHKSYADPLINHLDPTGRLGKIRLYREHCADVGGSKVKDLSLLGRPLHRIALLDNSPTSYFFQPRNGIPIASWYDDPNDTELLKMMPLLDALSGAKDVVDVLDVHHATVVPPS